MTEDTNEQREENNRAADVRQAKQDQSDALTKIAFGETGAQLQTMEDARRLAEAIVASNYFPGVALVPQAMIKLQFGAELGMPPIASILNIHLIDGKPSLSASMVAARVKQKGYRYVVKEASADVVVLEFFERDAETRAWLAMGSSSFTIDDARRAGLSGKKNWQGYPKAMLFARAMTQGARMFTPDVFFGAVYDPEELEDVDRSVPTGGMQVMDAIDKAKERAAPKPRKSSVVAVADSLPASLRAPPPVVTLVDVEAAGAAPPGEAESEPLDVPVSTVTPEVSLPVVVPAPSAEKAKEASPSPALSGQAVPASAPADTPKPATTSMAARSSISGEGAAPVASLFRASMRGLPSKLDTPQAVGEATKYLAQVEAAKTLAPPEMLALRMLARARYNVGRGKPMADSMAGEEKAALSLALSALES